MGATLTLKADSVSEETLSNVTRNICQALNREAPVRAKLAEVPAAPGDKGMNLDWGTIVLDVMTHGTGIVLGEAVLEILRKAFERFPKMIAVLRDSTGRELQLTAESVKPENVEKIARAIDEKLSA